MQYNKNAAKCIHDLNNFPANINNIYNINIYTPDIYLFISLIFEVL